MNKRHNSCSGIICCIMVLTSCFSAPVYAQSANNWVLGVTVKGGSIGTSIGVTPWGHDGYVGEGEPISVDPARQAVYLLEYYANGPDWSGPTGFSGEGVRLTPISPGGSKTWSNLYLWAQNVTLGPTNVVRVYPPKDIAPSPPAGYQGHLVLDYVPSSCNYTGPTDYWLDLTAYNELALPIPVVTDPLQGTRFHLTVYAPVPEPSCLAALGMGLAGIGGFAIRRRR